MPDQKQKDIWRQEKEQQRRDKLSQPREVKRRAVPLCLSADKPKPKGRTNNAANTAPNYLPDDLMRKRLGI